jgi:hypothetical protein
VSLIPHCRQFVLSSALWCREKALVSEPAICSLFGKTRIHKVFFDFILNWLVFCATVEIAETVTQV